MATVAELGAYAINPRGNLWLNDDSSFGQKMLLKMGWKKGKGLGKKEDGIKENLKVKFRNTNSGLGFKDDSYNNVMKTEYESILKSLRSEYPQQKSATTCNKNEELESGNLKQKSRIVKGRIRYPKLYSAKDVSRYSEKDMKSIFICSLPFEDNKEESKESGLCPKEESPNSGLSLNKDTKDSESYMKKEMKNDLTKPQETYTSQLSISDYFNMKMKGKKGDEQKACTSEIKQEIDSCHSKTNYEIEKTKSAFQSDRTKNTEIKSDSEGNKSVCELNQETEDIQNDMMTEDATRVRSRKKHKKKRKSSEISQNEGDCKTISSEKEWEETVNPHKKRKKMAGDLGHVCEEKMQGKSNLMVDELNVSDKKRKRHKKESLNSTDTIESSSNQSIVTTSYKKKKKSHRNDSKILNPIELLSVTSLKKEVSTNSQLANNVSTESLMETVGLYNETFTNIDNDKSEKKQKKLKNKFKSVKKLKSCLKSKSNDYTVKNVSFNESVSYKIIDSESESTSSVSDSEDENSKDFDITANNNPELKRDPSDTKTEMENCNIEQQNETNCINGSETVSEEKTKKCNSLSGFPSPDSPYYNPWVESQQQALKMEQYKNLLKGLKKHDILKTSNLSFIKGYGNWGF